MPKKMKERYSRREFAGLTGAAVAGLVGGSWPGAARAAEGQDADLVVFDAKQMTIVPGFIDCHNHARGEILLYNVLVGNPFVVEFVTIDSIVAKLRAKAQQTPPG